MKVPKASSPGGSGGLGTSPPTQGSSGALLDHRDSPDPLGTPWGSFLLHHGPPSPEPYGNTIITGLP